MCYREYPLKEVICLRRQLHTRRMSGDLIVAIHASNASSEVGAPSSLYLCLGWLQRPSCREREFVTVMAGLEVIESIYILITTCDPTCSSWGAAPMVAAWFRMV